MESEPRRVEDGDIDSLVIEAAAHHAAGRVEEALAVLLRARGLDAERADIHFNLGLYYAGQGDLKAAVGCFKDAVRCRPDWVEAHIYLAAYTLESGEVDQALELIDAGLRMAPDNKELHEQHAVATARKLDSRSVPPSEFEEIFGHLQVALSQLRAIRCCDLSGGDCGPVRRRIEALSRVRGAVALAEEALAREQAHSFNRGRVDRPGGGFPGSIILSTMPKSGSEYVWMALSNGLNLWPTRVSSAEMFEVIDGERLERVGKGGFVSHGHFRCVETNSVLLTEHFDRVVVHVRDPRQALVSWVNYQDHPDIRDLPVRRAWGNMADMAFEQRVDYFIEGFFVHQVKFLRSWMDAERDDEFLPRILFTRQEDLRADPQRFFRAILDFYDIAPELFQIPEPPKEGERHFRRGETDEWRRVLRPDQIDRLQAMLPDDILNRFCWLR